MIDYDQPDNDPVVAEVRRAREEFAAEFHNDLHSIFKEMQRRQAAAGRTYASIPPIKPVPPKSVKKAG